MGCLYNTDKWAWDKKRERQFPGQRVSEECMIPNRFVNASMHMLLELPR